MLIVNDENRFEYWYGMYFLGPSFWTNTIAYFEPRMFKLK